MDASNNIPIPLDELHERSSQLLTNELAIRRKPHVMLHEFELGMKNFQGIPNIKRSIPRQMMISAFVESTPAPPGFEFRYDPRMSHITLGRCRAQQQQPAPMGMGSPPPPYSPPSSSTQMRKEDDMNFKACSRIDEICDYINDAVHSSKKRCLTIELLCEACERDLHMDDATKANFHKFVDRHVKTGHIDGTFSDDGILYASDAPVMTAPVSAPPDPPPKIRRPVFSSVRRLETELPKQTKNMEHSHNVMRELHIGTGGGPTILKNQRIQTEFEFCDVEQLSVLIFVLQKAAAALQKLDKKGSPDKNEFNVFTVAECMDKMVGGSYDYSRHGFDGFWDLINYGLIVPVEGAADHIVQLHTHIVEAHVETLREGLEWELYQLLVAAGGRLNEEEAAMELATLEGFEWYNELSTKQRKEEIRAVAKQHSNVFIVDMVSPTTPGQLRPPFVALVNQDDIFVNVLH